MESQRSLLFIALMVVTYLLFSQWQQQNAPAVEPTTISQDVNVNNEQKKLMKNLYLNQLTHQ